MLIWMWYYIGLQHNAHLCLLIYYTCRWFKKAKVTSLDTGKPIYYFSTCTVNVLECSDKPTSITLSNHIQFGPYIHPCWASPQTNKIPLETAPSKIPQIKPGTMYTGNSPNTFTPLTQQWMWITRFQGLLQPYTKYDILPMNVHYSTHNMEFCLVEVEWNNQWIPQVSFPY